MYVESNNVQLTGAQRNDIHRGINHWLTETLPDAVSDVITMLWRNVRIITEGGEYVYEPSRYW